MAVEFDREKFERTRIGGKPGHIIDRHYRLSHSMAIPLLDGGEAYQNEMIQSGYWTKCPSCTKIINPRYEHVCH